MSQQGQLTTAGSGGAVVETLTGNSGGPVGPDATFNINILGNNTTGINVVGMPGTNTLSIVGIQATTTQRGTVTLATNAETITGTDTSKVITPDDLNAKLGAQTLHGLPIGAGSTAALLWTAAPTNGQLLIGNTGNNPTLGNITSTGGTITITNGPGTINLDLAGGGIAIDQIFVDFSSGTGTNPVVPNAGGQISVTGAQVATGTVGTNVIRAASLVANSYTMQIQRSTAVAATDVTKNGVSHFNSTEFTVDGNGFVSLADSPYFSLTPYIVGPDIHSQYATIAAAIAAAVGAGASTASPANIYVKPKNGGYTENNTLSDGINIVGFGGQVYVTGKFSMTGNGTASLSNLYLTTNSDYIISLTGANSPQLNIYNCYFNCSNNTAILYSAAGGGAIFIYNSNGNLATSGIAYFNDSSVGKITFIGGFYQNQGGSSTASTNSGTTACQFYQMGEFGNAVTTSGSGILGVFQSNMSGALIVNGTTGADAITLSNINGGTSSALSIGAGATCQVTHTDAYSSNTNVITGAGTLIYAIISFSGSSSTVNTSTVTPLATLI